MIFLRTEMRYDSKGKGERLRDATWFRSADGLALTDLISPCN